MTKPTTDQLAHNVAADVPLDVYGNIHTITVSHVRNMVREFLERNPDLADKVESLDKESLGDQIQDYIGGVGLVDHIEVAISEAIREKLREAEAGNDG